MSSWSMESAPWTPRPHYLEQIKLIVDNRRVTRWRCKVCTWQWAKQPLWPGKPGCPRMPRYDSWEEVDAAGMATQTQLRAKGLQPGPEGDPHFRAVMWYGNKAGWIKLYSIGEATSRRIRPPRDPDAPPPPAKIRGRWWFLANPYEQILERGGMPGEPAVYVGHGRYHQSGILHMGTEPENQPETDLTIPYHCSISPPAGTRYQVIYLAALPAEFHSKRKQPNADAFKSAGLDFFTANKETLQNVSQSYDDLFTAMNEVPLLSLDRGMPVRLVLWVAPRFVVDKAGVLRNRADLERHPDLGVWDQGSLLDRLLRWFFWWSPEPMAADWAPDITRRWLKKYGDITPEDEARLIELAERIGLGEVAAGRAYRCGQPGCLTPVGKDEAIKIDSLFYHEGCLSDLQREFQRREREAAQIDREERQVEMLLAPETDPELTEQEAKPV